jgi:hypothetical protein
MLIFESFKNSKQYAMNNSQTINETSGLRTPYQGKKRCFGQYKCEKCQKAWKSSQSKANEPQICNSCGNLIYPYKQVQQNSFT